jgi:hypothetical protein
MYSLNNVSDRGHPCLTPTHARTWSREPPADEHVYPHIIPAFYGIQHASLYSHIIQPPPHHVARHQVIRLGTSTNQQKRRMLLRLYFWTPCPEVQRRCEWGCAGGRTWFVCSPTLLRALHCSGLPLLCPIVVACHSAYTLDSPLTEIS